MKKLLLSVGLLVAVCFNADAAIYSQNFETSMTVIPASWTQQKAAATPTNKGWVFSNAYAPTTGYLAKNWATSGSYFAYVNDADNNSTGKSNKDTLYSTSFSLVGYAHVFVSLDVMYYQASETATIAASSDGGKTWTTIGTLTGVNSWTTETVNLSSFSGKSSVMLAICYADNGNWTWGMAIDNISVFVPTINYDLGVTAQNLAYLVQTGKAYTFTGTVYNYGADSIAQMHLNYSVNGGPAQTDVLTALTFNALTTYNFSHNIKWTPPVAGNYTVKFWADNLNGSNVDQKHANDTLVAYFMAVDTIQTKMVMVEEFTQASCDPCAAAKANVDSVLWNNKAYANSVRYHVNWPGQDFMNQVTQTPFVGARVGYYAISGVPDAKMDGSTDIYPGAGSSNSLASGIVQQEAAVGSPFKIIVNSCIYDKTSNKYSFNADIKSFGILPAGLKALVVLTVDTINYANNQSTETIPQTNFPYAAEDIMPNSSGTTLAAFTSGATQNVSVSWTKNHAWGASNKTWTYDSSKCHITLFIQDNSAIPAAGIPANYVFQSATALATVIVGMQEIAHGVYFELYPNPANNNANIAFSLEQEQNVKVDVFNVLGENVYSMNNSKMASGQHTINIDGSGLQSGVYFVKFTTDNASTTKRLIIQK